MWVVTQAQIEVWLALFWWPFLRIMGTLLSDPVFSNRRTPVRIRVGFAIVLTLVVVPILPPMPTVPVVSPDGMLIAARELIIGLSIGFVMRLVFTAVEMAGHLAGLQMGLGFASFYDPQTSANTLAVAQLMSLLMILLFLSMNGHLMMLRVLLESLVQLPVGQLHLNAKGFQLIANYGGVIFRAGVMLSIPVIAALLITNLSIGVMTRAAPQLNVFAIGFPITLAIGFGTLYYSLPFMVPEIDHLLAEYTRSMGNILSTFGR
ncbi:flagellar biosynthetic protein FliR [Chitinibacter bivalviorum]|uniref:Flagellar biosynthetic protein FliR n=1 Tax=Chitinibacter bivalviorum TaxID=2739434 RepID=A0A7H9BEY9_9NEIS|nr:flagellar biosynthetic protein FliR [Chitinibacter bivalviorum]QLG86796.1 flagellar biosynthetic protein FliR [Chitinibacter bivalviorum]